MFVDLFGYSPARIEPLPGRKRFNILHAARNLRCVSF